MIFDQTGHLAAMKRHDYLPFGEELTSQGLRSTTPGYSVGDTIRQKFTAKERDNETGLDYFGARYYGSMQARFSSPDPMLSSGDVVSPQSWNRYAYVGNNPLRYIDPLGLYEWDALTLGGDLSDQELKNLKKNAKSFGADPAAYQHVLDKRNEIRAALESGDAAASNRNLPMNERLQIAISVGSYGAEGQANGVTVGLGNLADNAGAQAQLVGFDRDSSGTAVRARVQVTIDEKTTGSDLAGAIAHEGRHIASDQAAVAVWTITGSYQTARNSQLNLTTYDNESAAYHVSASMANASGRPGLTYSDGGNKYQIWRRGMTSVDQQALNGLLSGHYHVTPTSQGSKILP